MSFSRKDLKTGMIVTTRNGTKYVVLLDTEQGDIIWNPVEGGFLKLSGYSNDLIRDCLNKYSLNYDIIKVMCPSAYGVSLNKVYGKTVFEGNKIPPVEVGDKLYNVYCKGDDPDYEVLFIHEGGESFFVEMLHKGQPTGETTVLNVGEDYWVKK